MRRAVAIAVICWSAHAYADGASVTGIVEDALMHPLEGATVVIHDPSGETVAKATTGKDGKFSFGGVPLGDFTVEASSPGLVGDHQHVQLTAGGVADALGNIYARGNHGSIQYQIDGVPVPDSVGSLFAASIPTRLVQSLEMYTGGMPAEYGDRLSAVVNLQTRAAGDHPAGTMQVRYGSFQTIEPGVTYSTKLADNWCMFAGGRGLFGSNGTLDGSIGIWNLLCAYVTNSS